MLVFVIKTSIKLKHILKISSCNFSIVTDEILNIFENELFSVEENSKSFLFIFNNRVQRTSITQNFLC